VPAGKLDSAAFVDAIQHGRTFATNGPLLGLTLGSAGLGEQLHLERPQAKVPFRARLRSLVGVDHLDLVCNGQVLRSFVRGKSLSAGDFSGTVELQRSGWCLLRASTEGARYPVLDNYVYATTSPIYVDMGGTPPAAPEDARFFVAWIDRVTEATQAYPDWNSAAEKSHVLGQLATARALYMKQIH
jgi:hypothetical protein